MVLYKCLLTDNPCYKEKAKINPKGIMVHSTGANNPLLRRYVQPLSTEIPNAYDPSRQDLLYLLGTNPNRNDWNKPNLDKCVHGFIGKLADGSIAAIQTLPWNHRGWHAGNGTSGRSANDTHISFEICEDALSDPSYFQQTKDTAVELTSMLCKEYDLDPLADGVVICHKEGYLRGIASQHGDVLHWWPKHGYSMDDFRNEVKRKMEEDNMVYYETLDDVPEWYKPTIEKLVNSGDLKGQGDGILHISEDSCRIFTILDRRGKL